VEDAPGEVVDGGGFAAVGEGGTEDEVDAGGVAVGVGGGDEVGGVGVEGAEGEGVGGRGVEVGVGAGSCGVVGLEGEQGGDGRLEGGRDRAGVGDGVLVEGLVEAVDGGGEGGGVVELVVGPGLAGVVGLGDRVGFFVGLGSLEQRLVERGNLARWGREPVRRRNRRHHPRCTG
jgi:hypothetical protein